jgi:hypothetical protein
MLMKLTMYDDLENDWPTWPISKFRARIGFHLNFSDLRISLSFQMYYSWPVRQFEEIYASQFERRYQLWEKT